MSVRPQNGLRVCERTVTRSSRVPDSRAALAMTHPLRPQGICGASSADRGAFGWGKAF